MTAPHGTPDAYREYIGEMTSLAKVQAELATTYAAIGDDTGLRYAVSHLVAYTRAAVATLADLQDMKQNGGQHGRTS
jgi:hypothetical protein